MPPSASHYPIHTGIVLLVLFDLIFNGWFNLPQMLENTLAFLCKSVYMVYLRVGNYMQFKISYLYNDIVHRFKIEITNNII